MGSQVRILFLALFIYLKIKTMSAKPTMSADEARWRAEEDARTMARYEEIMSDTKRRTAAVKEAKRQAEDLNKRANVMTRVAGTKKSTKK